MTDPDTGQFGNAHFELCRLANMRWSSVLRLLTQGIGRNIQMAAGSPGLARTATSRQRAATATNYQARHLKAEKGLAYEIEKSIAANTLSRAAITMAALLYVNGA